MIKLLIVDDEQWILDGLRRQLDWNSLDIEIVCEAQNGADAIEKHEIYKPELILTDIRMPVMDGLQLAQYVQERLPECAVIIMSGYADFEYAQRALKYGVTSFISKPVDRIELKEAVTKACNTISQRKTLHALDFSSKFSSESLHIWKHFKQEGNLPIDGRAFVIEVSKELSTGELKYLLRFLKNRCIDIMQMSYSDVIFVGICTKQHAGEPLSLKACIESMMKGIRVSYNAVISVPLKEQHNIEHYTQHLMLVINSIRGLKDNVVILEEEFKIKQNLVSIPYNEVECLLKSIDNSDSSAAEKSLDVIHPFFMDSLNYEHGLLLQRLLSGLDALLRKHGIGVEQVFSDNIHFISRLGADMSRENEYQVLCKGIEKSIAYLRDQRICDSGKVVKAIQEYIDEHYNDELSLGMLSNKFFIASTYLSREFKKNTGTNLNRYIRQKRLFHAAELLCNTDLKTTEVSVRVGYDNPDYFMKLFREEYSMTPSAYRKMINGKIIE